MDENIGYSGDVDEDSRMSSSQWYLANESLVSLERDSSKQFLQYRNYHLHLIKKKKPVSERRIIPATKNERLSYFRNYVSSPNKAQIACMHQKSFNSFFWEYVTNSFCKSLQHTFTNIFLASYAPEEHLFLSKMVPLMYGIKFSFIITGLLEIITCISNTTRLLDYLIGGIFLKNPWNRCPKNGFNYLQGTEVIKINCYNVMDFGNKVKNKTVLFFKHFYYIIEDEEMLQIVQIEYFRYRVMTISTFLKLFYTCFIWGLIVSCHKSIYNRNFWQVFNIVHWCVISLDIVSFAYLMFYYFEEDYVPKIDYAQNLAYTFQYSHADFDFLAESTTAPPVVHVLTARSTQEILPGRDSAVIVLSNAICFLFRALLSFRVKQHCESLVKVPILMPGFVLVTIFLEGMLLCFIFVLWGPNQGVRLMDTQLMYSTLMHSMLIGIHFVENAWLYFWPMYFSTFFLGDMYTLLFLMLNFAIEIMTTVVTFQCLLEAVVNEWPTLRRGLVSSILIIIAVNFATFFPVDFSLVLAYNKSTATMLECIVLYCLYPVYRLMDDISFHSGSAPHFIRKQLLILVPFYYLDKYYNLMISTVSLLIQGFDTKFIIHALIWALSLLVVPLFLGMIYTIYKYVLKDSRSWTRMFAPSEDWGPRDYNTRQLRKDYDSRTYNKSQAPRNLSRHIICKVEAKAYHLDIRYDTSRRSNVPNFDYRTENEKES